MTKIQLSNEIIKLQASNGLVVWEFEKAMKNTKAFLECKYEYLNKKYNK